MSNRLYIDIETYSPVDIKSCGAYKYTRSPEFEILLIAYALDDNEIKIVDFGEELPEEFTEAFFNPNVEKWAHNASFERNAFKAIGLEVSLDQWRCSAVKAAYCGLPLHLEALSKVMQLEEKGKLATGKALIRYFCCPVKATKANGGRTRNYPRHDVDKWAEFKRYCINDVEAERAIIKALAKYEIPEFEQLNYIIDQEINDRGVLIDAMMAINAVEIDDKFSEKLGQLVKDATGVDNPNSAAQLKKWLGNKTGEIVDSLSKENVKKLHEEIEDEEVLSVLESRAMLAKSSTKKYISMLNCACEDGRAHGLFQFYGANRTGRWAGRLIQLQNLPQNHMRDLDLARKVIKSGDYELANMLYDNIPTVLSELIRTALVAPEGYTFAVCDYSAIEARVLSWVAGEQWRLDVFKSHGKIYEASAAMMFGVPIESIKKGSELRQRGKVAELALGYQGGENAVATMDRDGKIPENERQIIVTKWRKANPKIVKLWGDVERSFKESLQTRRVVRLRCLTFQFDGQVLRLGLPSGRALFYNKPCLGTNRFGGESIKFAGMDQTTKQWGWVETYGGKLVENIIQAIARDLLAVSLQRLREVDFRIVMHVHDEVICEVEEKFAEDSLQCMSDLTSDEVSWAKGLPLSADGYLTKYYKKD